MNTVHDIILSYMRLSGNSNQVGYIQLREAAELSWYSLFKKTKESHLRKWVDVVDGKLDYPKSAENILGVYHVDDCNNLIALTEDNVKNTLLKPAKKCTCNSCDVEECLCPTTAETPTLKEVLIDGDVYINKTWTRVLKSGDVVEHKEEWTGSYDSSGEFIEAVMLESQSTICKLETKSCGCIANTEINAQKLDSCGCLDDNCAPYVRRRYAALYNSVGYYKKDDVNRKIHLFGSDGRPILIDSAIVLYQSNGVDMLVPDYARTALIALMDATKKMYSPVFTRNDRDEAKRNAKYEKNQMMKYLMPIPYEVVVQSEAAWLNRKGVTTNGGYSCNTGLGKIYGDAPKIITKETVVEKVIKETILIDGYTAITAKVDGLEGSPVVDLFVYQNDILKGATELEFILVNKSEETRIDGDFTFNSSSGIITRTNPWQENDTVVIPFKKALNN